MVKGLELLTVYAGPSAATPNPAASRTGVSIWRRIATPPRATANTECRFIGNARKVLRTAANLLAAANTQCHYRPDKHDTSSQKERHQRPVGNPFAKLLKTLKVAEVLEHKGQSRLPLNPRVEAP
jgi:hypothetical protein